MVYLLRAICMMALAGLLLSTSSDLVASSKTEEFFNSNSAKLREILEKSKFSGVIDNNVKVSKIGLISDSEKQFFAYSYHREFGNYRMENRILFFTADDRYVGMYFVDDLPTSINAKCLLFPYSQDWGNELCLVNGKLPQKLLLNGTVLERTF